MDVERYLLSTALSGIISQRLAKMLCPTCRYQRNTTKYEQKVFKKFMNMDVLKIWDSNPKGCEHCRRGYRGRIAIHEVLEIDDDIRSALSNDKVEKKDLAKMVYSGNTITMLQDALIKCLEGKTSFEEVYKNIEIENEDDDNYENEINKKKEEAIKKEEVEEESDDLLEPIKKDNKNDIKNIITPPTFTAEDFNDTKKDKNQEVKIPNIIPNKDKQTENTKSNTIIKIPTFTSNNQNTNNPINNLIKKPVVPAVPISQNKKEENIPRL